ncbi:MAG: hypothetical protein AB1445_11355 [Bacillota bacterium]
MPYSPSGGSPLNPEAQERLLGLLKNVPVFAALSRGERSEAA